VPGRSGKAYSDWLEQRGEDFKNGVEVATLDAFHGYKNAIDDQLEDATAVLDAFHVVKLGTQALPATHAAHRRRTHPPPPQVGRARKPRSAPTSLP
jgi:transposase